jgi:CRISPR-associated protein (Cas_Cas02710)
MTNKNDPLLILLVGANPLPNYLAACALRPRRIALVHSEATRAAKDRLKEKLKQKLGDTACFEDPDPFVEDAACATTVKRAIDPLFRRGGDPGDVLLNYTGGTKVMAAHARMAFLESGGKPEHASYVDEGGTEQQPRLRFDSGHSKLIADYADVPLDLRTILDLHDITHEPRHSKQPAPTAQDAREILCKVLRDVPLAAALYCERERLEDKEYKNPSKAVSAPFQASRYGLTLSVNAFPTDEQLSGLSRRECESWFKQWYKFIGGEWLEEWVAEQVLALAPELDIDPRQHVSVGFDAFRGGSKDKQLEIDVAVVRGHRSYFISCTTDATKTICKSKLFEIAVRSRQLGGDLARAALVCLADDRVLGQLRSEVDDRPDVMANIRVSSVADVQVFGLSDMANWSDCDGKQSNRHSLKDWLGS